MKERRNSEYPEKTPDDQLPTQCPCWEADQTPPVSAVLLTLPPSKAADMAHLWRSGPNTTSFCSTAHSTTKQGSRYGPLVEKRTKHHQFLQSCSLYHQARQQIWPTCVSLKTKLWGSADVFLTSKFAGTHRREDIVNATITLNAEEEEGWEININNPLMDFTQTTLITRSLTSHKQH